MKIIVTIIGVGPNVSARYRARHLSASKTLALVVGAFVLLSSQQLTSTIDEVVLIDSAPAACMERRVFTQQEMVQEMVVGCQHRKGPMWVCYQGQCAVKMQVDSLRGLHPQVFYSAHTSSLFAHFFDLPQHLAISILFATTNHA